jgi:hypothetical protein
MHELLNFFIIGRSINDKSSGRCVKKCVMYAPARLNWLIVAS